jgi:hypothetical protein
MFGSEILEVVIGIIFIYILVSILCTAIREGIESWLKTRAVYLEDGIRELLNDKTGEGLATHFYNHPLIFSLFSGAYKPGESSKLLTRCVKGTNLPSYIPAKNFALALMDIAARGPVTNAASSDPYTPIVCLDTVRMNIANLKNESVQRAVLTAIDCAQGNLNRAQANLEAWYDGTMDRVSGWYKRQTQWIVFGLCLAVTVGLNINTITIVDYLSQNNEVRAALVKKVIELEPKDSASPNPNYDEVKKELNSMSLPIGWTAGWGAPRRSGDPESKIGTKFEWWNDIFAPFLGWFMTAFAATLGAPFWFDVLNKVMVIRSTVKPHEKSPEEASEDRQFPTRQVEETRNTNPGSGQGNISVPIARTGSQANGTGVWPYQWQTRNPMDNESSIDGCDIDISTGPATSDEELPEAEGGVA